MFQNWQLLLGVCKTFSKFLFYQDSKYAPRKFSGVSYDIVSFLIPNPNTLYRCSRLYQESMCMVWEGKVAISRTQRNILRYISSGIADGTRYWCNMSCFTMTGAGSGDTSRDEDELRNRCVTSRVLPMSCTRHKSDPHHLRGMSNWGQVDHPRLEEWLLECGNPIPYISNDNFSPEDTFIVMTSHQDTLMSTKQTLMSLECVNSSMVTLHVEVG